MRVAEVMKATLLKKFIFFCDAVAVIEMERKTFTCSLQMIEY